LCGAGALARPLMFRALIARLRMWFDIMGRRGEQIRPCPPVIIPRRALRYGIAPKHLKHPARKERHMVAKTLGVGLLLVFGLLNRAAAAETMDVTKDVSRFSRARLADGA
jgi:hypothetical protein